MTNAVDSKEARKLIKEYERKWGKTVDCTILPGTITQEDLVVVLRRIIETGESILVGWDNLFHGSNGFDFDKYIWQIQFHTYDVLSSTYISSKIIDYLNKIAIVKDVNILTGEVEEATYTIRKDRFKGLLELSEIKKIIEFEAKSPKELESLNNGYRDGCKLEYTYFVQKGSLIHSGDLHYVYDENPIEEILKWVDDLIEKQ